jgi:cytochrome c biogenesis factor
MKKINDLLTVHNSILATVSVLVLLAALIVMGLLTPFIVKITTGEKILLDATYFNVRTAVPVLALVILLIICLLMGSAGKKESIAVLGLGIAGSGLSAYFSLFPSMPINIAFPLLAAALFAGIYRLISLFSLKDKALKGNMRRVGSHIIHLGVILLLLGIVFSTNMKQEDSAVIHTGKVATFESMGYSIYVTNISSGVEGKPFSGYSGSAYVSTVDFDVYRRGRLLDQGQIRYISDYKWGQAYTETYIHRGLLEELFIAPKSVDTEGEAVDLYVRKVPFMTFLWGGFYIMALGMVMIFVSEFLFPETKKKVKL